MCILCINFEVYLSLVSMSSVQLYRRGKAKRLALDLLVVALILMMANSFSKLHQRSAACKLACSLLYSSTECVLKKKSLLAVLGAVARHIL